MADACEFTELVVTVNVVLALPCGTVTVPACGTWAAAVLSLETFTVAPPLGATPLKVTVAVEDCPPVTVVGLRPTDCTTKGPTARAAVLVTAL